MTEFKGTTGKWEVALNGNNKLAVWVGGSLIATVVDFPHIGGTANARLIAAAPDMLEALELIISFNRQQALDQYGDSEKAESWACVETARKAINKALGSEVCYV